MLRLQALQLTSAVKVSLCTYRNIGISIVGEVNREITPQDMYVSSGLGLLRQLKIS